MSIAETQELSKVDSLAQMAEGIDELVERAAQQGVSMREFERDVFDRLLKMGHAATERFLALLGDGDRGETVADETGRTLYRSEEPANRPLRTIFGEHQFSAYVYRQRRHPNTPIVLRPIDEGLGIEPNRWSPLLQEFTMLFGIEHSFRSAVDAFEITFRQRLSVDTLEKVSQRMGERAGGFLDNLDAPPADEEGELLVQTADGKGVPMVREDARRLKSFEEKPQRPGNRRMATLAGVYSVDRFVRTPEQIIEALFREERESCSAVKPSRPKPSHTRLVAHFPHVIDEIDDAKPISGALLALRGYPERGFCDKS